VAGCAVTAKGLDRLRDLDELRQLDASKLKCVSDALLCALSFKMKLECVALVDCGSRLGRDGLLALVLNCPELRRLDVRGCKRVSHELAAELRKCQLREFLCSAPQPAPQPAPSCELFCTFLETVFPAFSVLKRSIFNNFFSR